MNVGFPPIVKFPFGIDDDSTLFLVYNTAETQTTSDNDSWSDTISITPVDADDPEQWASNGFANINGELFYYDAVDLNGDGKVTTLKRCARNLGGSNTQFNPTGTWVRGYVVAEHHNQLAQALMILENIIGVSTCVNPSICGESSLTCNINRMQIEPACVDDNACPAVNFSFVINQTPPNVDPCSDAVAVQNPNPCQGTVASFNVAVTGSFNSYRLDFGDGNFTTSDFQGQYTYAPNAVIDPVVTLTNDTCQLVQTPTNRSKETEPEPAVTPAGFTIPLPTIPDFPILSIPVFTLPSQTLELPQFVGPCLDLNTSFVVPSIISIVPPIPSIIQIVGAITPIILEAPNITPISLVAPSLTPIVLLVPNLTPIVLSGPNLTPISIVGPSLTPIELIAPSLTPITLQTPTLSPIVLIGPTLTPIVLIGPTLSPIVLLAPSLSPISLVIPSNANISLVVPSNVSIPVNWSPVPTLSCVVTVSCPTNTGPLMAPLPEDLADPNLTDTTFLDDFGGVPLELDVSDVGIPSEIKVVPPDIPDINVVHDIPSAIAVESNIPSIIKVIGPDKPIPHEIKINANSVPKTIELVAVNVPKSIKLDASDVVVRLETPSDFPTTIRFDTSDIPDSIQVTGIPPSITIVGEIPSEIVARLEVPENLAIPMIYTGAPVPLQLQMTPVGSGTDDEYPCFKFVPCGSSK